MKRVALIIALVLALSFLVILIALLVRRSGEESDE